MNKSALLIGDVLMIVFFFFFPHLGILPMYAFPVVLLLICWLWLRIQKKNFATIGFKWNQIPARAFITGIMLGIIYFFINYFLIGPSMNKLLHIPKADVSDFYFVRKSFSSYITILVIAWCLAIPFEEIIFRGFIFYKLLQWTKKHFWIAGIISSFIFGLYHFQQGIGGIVHAFIFGMVAIGLYKYFKGNLWYLIFFHCAYDTVAITAIRLNYF